MNNKKTNFYIPQLTKLTNINIKERGLDHECSGNKKHQWLLLPKKRGQKQYVICLTCMEASHL